jgi:hypothetical protein
MGKDICRMDMTDVEEVLALFYCMVKAACKAEGVEFDTDFPTFEDFAVAVTPEQMTEFQAIQEAEQSEQAKETEESDSKKKRAKK